MDEIWTWPAGDIVLLDSAAPRVEEVVVRSGVVEIQLSEEAGLADAPDPRVSTTSAAGNAYGSHGRPVDPETGLIYFRNRNLDPEQGRFVTVDGHHFERICPCAYRQCGKETLMIRETCFVALSVTLACASVSPPWKRTIRGSVVAYDQSAAVANITFAPHVDILIVKVEGASRSDHTRSFKRVVLSGSHGEPLPQGLFERGHQWRFAASASRNSDACTGPLPLLKWLDEQVKSNAPDLTRIECLEARRSGVKMAHAKRPQPD